MSVLINGNDICVTMFPKNWYCPTLQLGYTEHSQKMKITSLKNCLSTFNFAQFFCAFHHKINQVEKTLNLRLKWYTTS